MERQGNSQVNKLAIMVVTMVSNFFNPLMGSAVNVALPKIGKEFGMDAVSMSWVTMAYLLSSAVFLVPFGKASDIWGRRRIFFLGSIFFTLSAFVCALSPTGFSLIGFRLFQGFGGAMMYCTSMAIIVSAFPPQERGKVIGLNVSAVYLGLSTAPVLGGFLTEIFGWRSLFYVNGFVSLIITIIIHFKIKAEWTEAKGETFDYIGSIIFMPSFIALMYGFSKLPDTNAVILAIVGLIGIIVFVLIEMRVPYPILNMKLFFENAVFASSNLSAFINYAATFAISFVLSLYLQYAKHMTPKEAGMVLITQPVLMAFVAIFSGRLSDRVHPRWLASSGMAVSVGGLLMLSFIGADTPIVYIISALAVLGFGFGMFSSPNTNMIMGSVEKKFLGVASATVGTMRTTGMMFSMAIATLSVYLFIGKNPISNDNLGNFIQSSHVIFIIFTILCTIGVFTSFIGKKDTRRLPNKISETQPEKTK
ncbi:MAG: Multidrug resistance protein stp [Bacteroidetes bacterium ADurb.Bin408]|nr:MAG: Multidrug resistance protein stp [Bacteroidetes bacterium ADurb.Bin408]